MPVADRWSWPGGAPVAVTITFDGGYLEAVENAVPILERHAVRATWFLVAGAVGRTLEGRPVADWAYWSDLGAGGEVANHTFSHPILRPPPGAWLEDIAHPKRLAGRIARRVGLRPGDPPRVRGERTNRRVGPASLVDDASRGKVLLESRTGRSVRSFAYPSGRFSEPVAERLLAQGHTSLRTTLPGVNHPDTTDLRWLQSRVWTQSTRDQEGEQWIAEAMAVGGWHIEVHHLVARESEYAWTTSPRRLDDHLGRIAETGAWIATQEEVAAHIARQPRVVR